MLPPESPQATASLFVHTVLAGEMRAAWAVTDESLRRELASAWVEIRGVASEGAVEGLVASGSLHPLWLRFAPDMVTFFGGQWAHVDLEVWGWAMGPRPSSVDCETVVLVDRTDVRAVVGESIAVPAIELLMRHGEDGWWVAETSCGSALTSPAAEGDRG